GADGDGEWAADMRIHVLAGVSGRRPAHRLGSRAGRVSVFAGEGTYTGTVRHHRRASGYGEESRRRVMKSFDLVDGVRALFASAKADGQTGFLPTDGSGNYAPTPGLSTSGKRKPLLVSAGRVSRLVPLARPSYISHI